MLLLKVVGNVKLTGTGTGYEVFSVAGDITDYKASNRPQVKPSRL
jgi:hypothetical protein